LVLFCSITIVYPANNTRHNDVGLNVNYSLSGSTADTCLWTNDNGATNTTLTNCANITTVTWSEATQVVTIWANDSSDNWGSDTITFIIDTTSPIITKYIPLSDNSSIYNSDFNMSQKGTDNEGIFSQNISVYNESGDSLANYVYLNYTDELNTTTIHMNDTINVSDFSFDGVYTIKTVLKDLHTDKNWNPKPTITSGSDYINFNFGERDDVKIIVQGIEKSGAVLGDSTLKEFLHAKAQDRYNFHIEFTDNVKQYELKIEAKDIFIVGNSKYKGHLVINGNYWFDTEPLNSVIKEVGKGYIILTIDNKDSTISQLNSLGGLNTVTEYVEFEVDKTRPSLSITTPLNSTNHSSKTVSINYTFSDTNIQSCYWSNNTGTTNHTLASCGTNITGIDWDEGSNTIWVYANDTAGNTNHSESITFTVDTTAPSCSLISRTPSDLNESSTGVFEVLINCTDSANINVSSMLFTRVIAGDLTFNPPFNWSYRPPSNNKGAIDGSLYPGEYILLADGRGDNKWYDRYEVAGNQLFDDNYSYAVNDNSSIKLTVTSAGNSAVLNFSWNVEPSALENMVFLSRGNMEKESKKDYSIYNNNPLLVKFWNFHSGKGNYTTTAFLNVNYTDNPNKNLNLYFCNSSYDPTGNTAPQNDIGNCVYIDTKTQADLDEDRDYISRNSSYVKNSYGIVNDKLGGIYATPIIYIYYQSDTSTSTKAYYVRYANESSGTNVSFKDSKVAWTSTDEGTTWIQAEFTPDIWISQSHTDSHFLGGVYVEDMLGNNYTNFSFIHDDIGDVNHPISTPIIFSYNSSANTNDLNLNETHLGIMNIKVNVAIDPDAVGNVTHNLTLRNTDGTLNYTINTSFFSADDSYVYVNFNTSKVTDGIYRMNISAWSYPDKSDMKSYLTEENFTINQTYIYDREYPSFSDYVEGTTNNTEYHSTACYEFNTTITSTNGTAIFSFRGTNYTASNLTTTLFNVTICDLPAGNYIYNWSSYGNGTNANFNYSEIRSYTIVLNSTYTASLSSSSGWTFNVGTATNITYSESNQGDDDLNYTILRDNYYVGNGESINLSAGVYSYVLNTTLNATNYSEIASLDTETLTINQLSSDIDLYINGTQSNTTMVNGTGFWINATRIAGDENVSIYVDGIKVNSSNSANTKYYYTFSTIKIYNITAIYHNSINYTFGYDNYNITVEGLEVTINSPIDGSPGNITFNSSLNTQGYCEYSLNSGTTNTTMITSDNTYFFNYSTQTAGTYTANFYCNDTLGNENYTESVIYTLSTVTPPRGGGGGGGDTYVPFELDNYLCNKTYQKLLIETPVNVDKLQEEIFLEKGKLVQGSTLNTYLSNWQGLCSDNISRTLQPDKVCEQIFFMVLRDKKYNETDKETVIKYIKDNYDLSISKELFDYYINNHYNLCFKKGYSEKLPFKPFNIVFVNRSQIKNCSTTIGIGFFDTQFPFPDINIGQNLSCERIDTLRWLFGLEEFDNNYKIVSLKLWYMLILVGGLFVWFILRRMDILEDLIKDLKRG